MILCSSTICCLSLYVPFPTQPKPLRKAVLSYFQKYENLTVEGCIFQFFTLVTRLLAFDIETFQQCAIEVCPMDDDVIVRVPCCVITGWCTTNITHQNWSQHWRAVGAWECRGMYTVMCVCAHTYVVCILYMFTCYALSIVGVSSIVIPRSEGDLIRYWTSFSGKGDHWHNCTRHGGELPFFVFVMLSCLLSL